MGLCGECLGAVARDFQHVPAWVCPGDQAREPPDPGGDRIEGPNLRPRHQQRLGAGASDRQRPDLRAGAAESALQVQNDFTALGAEQMVPGAGQIASLEADGEDIDMPRRDLQRVPAMVEKLWMTAVECDTARRTGAWSPSAPAG